MDDQILISLQQRIRDLEQNATHYRIAEDGTAMLTWSGGRTSLTGAGAAPSEDMIRPVFNVYDYGAVGAGFADDTAAVQSAINAAEATSGGIIFFHRGSITATA